MQRLTTEIAAVTTCGKAGGTNNVDAIENAQRCRDKAAARQTKGPSGREKFEVVKGFFAALPSFRRRNRELFRFCDHRFELSRRRQRRFYKYVGKVSYSDET
jgi:hypothetical protein